MGIVENILVTTAALGGVGATIDFYLGASGQKRLKAWLEEKWYRFHDVNWHNFSEKEAQAYIDFVDRVFGASLLSWRRLISSVLVISSVTIALAVVWYFYREPTTAWSMIGKPAVLKYVLLVSVVDCGAFALSISFARWISLAVVRLNRSLTGILPFLLLVVFHYALLVLWRPIIDTFLMVPKAMEIHTSWTEVQNLLSQIVVTKFTHLAVTPKAVVLEYYDALTSISHLPDTLLLYNLMSARAWIMSLIANGLRFLFAVLLLVSFVARAWLGPAFSTTWARLVESEKPIFTMVFGAVGAVATTMKELAKLL